MQDLHCEQPVDVLDLYLDHQGESLPIPHRVFDEFLQALSQKAQQALQGDATP